MMIVSEDDWNGWVIYKSLADKAFVGDDLFVTNKKRLLKAYKERLQIVF